MSVSAAGEAADTAWQPLLTEPARMRALSYVDALRARIDSEPLPTDASLSTGAAGLAVFYGEVDRAGVSSAAAAESEAALARAAEILAAAEIGASLYAGFTGVAWAAELGAKRAGSGEDVNEEIDAAVLQVLERVDWQHAPFDVIYGLTGLGVYAAERMPRPAAEKTLSRVVAELARLAREEEKGAFWWTAQEILLGPRREQNPEGGVDLGVAHGIAGVIPLLARAAALGIAVERATDLADRAVAWLLAHAIEGEVGPTMPSFLAQGEQPRSSRIAWCYGDAGVAAALIAAGQDAKRSSWIEAGRELALEAAARPPEASGVSDAGFCHGSAGVAHLFNRMYQATGEPWLRQTAEYWLEQTLDRLERDDESSPPYNGIGLLEGAAGVGLVLLAAVTAAEPHWDGMYLVAPLRR